MANWLQRIKWTILHIKLMLGVFRCPGIPDTFDNGAKSISIKNCFFVCQQLKEDPQDEINRRLDGFKTLIGNCDKKMDIMINDRMAMKQHRNGNSSKIKNMQSQCEYLQNALEEDGDELYKIDERMYNLEKTVNKIKESFIKSTEQYHHKHNILNQKLNEIKIEINKHHYNNQQQPQQYQQQQQQRQQQHQQQQQNINQQQQHQQNQQRQQQSNEQQQQHHNKHQQRRHNKNKKKKLENSNMDIDEESDSEKEREEKRKKFLNSRNKRKNKKDNNFNNNKNNKKINNYSAMDNPPNTDNNNNNNNFNQQPPKFNPFIESSSASPPNPKNNNKKLSSSSSSQNVPPTTTQNKKNDNNNNTGYGLADIASKPIRGLSGHSVRELDQRAVAELLGKQNMRKLCKPLLKNKSGPFKIVYSFCEKGSEYDNERKNGNVYHIHNGERVSEAYYFDNNEITSYNKILAPLVVSFEKIAHKQLLGFSFGNYQLNVGTTINNVVSAFFPGPRGSDLSLYMVGLNKSAFKMSSSNTNKVNCNSLQHKYCCYDIKHSKGIRISVPSGGAEVVKGKEKWLGLGLWYNDNDIICDNDSDDDDDDDEDWDIQWERKPNRNYNNNNNNNNNKE